ncbi:MAG: low molecular weight protein arginine phosphatase [Desulfobacterales bacterium]
MNDSFRLLFVCTGNICRSPMAEGLMKILLPPASGHHIIIRSAGTHAADGLPAESGAVRAAREHGADIGGHRSRALDGSLIASANLILVMERQQARFIQSTAPVASEALRLLGEFAGSEGTPEIPDPYGGSFAVYRRCAQMIRGCLDGVIDFICQ